MSAPPPALVVLAAGASRRLGRCKATAPLAGRTAVDRLLDAALAVHEHAWVVTGAHHDEIAAALAGRASVSLLHHADWAAGRSGSVARAVRELPRRDLLVAPVDCPLVGPGVHRALLAAWQRAQAPPLGWCAPRTAVAPAAVRHGHPVLLGRDLLARVAAGPPDRPLKDWRAEARPLLDARVEDLSVLDDLDTSEDLSRLSQRVLDRPSDGT